MDLVTYIRVIQRWLWLILLVGFLAGGAAYLAAKAQTLQYQASTTIQVGSAQYSQNPATDQLLTSQQLADTYAVIVKTYPVLEATVNKLQLNMRPSDLSRLFQVSIVAGTSLLRITVTYTDPELASQIANQLALELIANSPISSMSEQEARENLLSDEIEQTTARLEKARADLAIIEKQVSRASGTVLSDLITRQDSLATQLTQAQDTLAQLTNTLAYLQKEGSSNSLQVVEQARVPTTPSNSSSIVLTLLAAVAGSGLTTGVLLVREFLNDNIRNPSELNSRFGLNILGTVPNFSTRKSKLIMWQQPRSAVAEAYRILRDNLIYLERHNGHQPRVYVVTSATALEGKSITAANLAVAFAITGERVLLLDANLHHPTQHVLFNLPNNIGLSDVLTYNKNINIEDFPMTQDQGINNGDAPYDTFGAVTSNVLPMTAALMSKTEIPGLDVITVGGGLETMPAEAFGIPRIQELIYKLATSSSYDTVIVDSSPLLAFSDTTVIASVTRGLVVMVVEPGRTRQGSVVRAVQQLASLSLPLAGIVLNRYHPRELDANYGLYTYGHYEGIGNGDQPNGAVPEIASNALPAQDAAPLAKARTETPSKDL